MSDQRKGAVSDRLLGTMIGLVVVAWPTSLVLDATGIWADPPDTIGLAFMAVLGPLVGVWAARAAANAPDRRSREDDSE